jgi:uncharacterized protein YjlB
MSSYSPPALATAASKASDDFLVIGAYPENEHWDICRTAPTPEVLERMRHVRFPASDPLTGAAGALPKLWPQT